MTRAEVIRWVCGACVLVPFIVPPASAQALTPDEHGFIVAESEAMVPIEGSRSVRLLASSGVCTLVLLNHHSPQESERRLAVLSRGCFNVLLGPGGRTRV